MTYAGRGPSRVSKQCRNAIIDRNLDVTYERRDSGELVSLIEPDETHRVASLQRDAATCCCFSHTCVVFCDALPCKCSQRSLPLLSDLVALKQCCCCSCCCCFCCCCCCCCCCLVRAAYLLLQMHRPDGQVKIMLRRLGLLSSISRTSSSSSSSSLLLHLSWAPNCVRP